MNTVTESELLLSQPHAAVVYLASLPTAGIFNAEPSTLKWGALRYQHTAAVRAKLAQAYKYKPATANKMLSALRGSLV